MPSESDIESGLHLDYTDSPRHRFKSARSRGFNHLTDPADTLHISNIPDGATEADLVPLFKPHGDLLGFRFFHNTNSMAQVGCGVIWMMEKGGEGVCCFFGRGV